MKKVLSWMLLLAMLMSFAACGDAPQATEPSQTQEPELVAPEVNGFSVGYSKRNVNPEGQIPLVGYSNAKFRWAKEIIDNVYTTAVAMADGNGNTVILINADLATVGTSLLNSVRTSVSAKTGVPQSNIILSGTHSHSLPEYADNSIYEAEQYCAFLTSQIVQGAVEAWQDMKPAKLYVGSIETENMNFVRHYTMSDGSVISDNHGTAKNKTYIGHAKDADPTLHVAKVTREGGKDIVICNWRAHPHFTGGGAIYNLSSDFVGPFGEAVEDLTGAGFLFLQGAAGNINEKSRIASENRTTDHRTYGAIMADYTVQCLENNMTEVTTDQIRVKQNTVYGDIAKISTELYYAAKEVYSVFQVTGDATQAMTMDRNGLLQSAYHASAVTKNYKRTKEVDGAMELTAVSIGDSFAFVTFPGEAYDTISERVEEASPYDFTMFVGYCNGHIGYLPDEAAFEYGCYEVDITRFERGTDSMVVEAYLELLTAIAEE